MSAAERRLVQARLAEDVGEADQDSSDATCVILEADVLFAHHLIFRCVPDAKMYDDRLLPTAFLMASTLLSAMSRFGFSCS